ncbi:MAG: GpE family phage tail protein [Pseudomonadota bacterium]|nr:GpE family phage tail protein [Pseudomonadota bacterium]
MEDAIADIAAIFHWSLSDLIALPLDELSTWWNHARKRSGDPDDE